MSSDYVDARLSEAKPWACGRLLGVGVCHDRRVSASSTTFDQLYDLLRQRAAERPEGSGTVAALEAGTHFIGKKVLEEAGEVWLAAEHGTDDELAAEISQLLYWLQVTMIDRGLDLDDVYRHL